MLLHARTDTRWFHDFIYQRAEIRFIKGRLRFGGASSDAPFPSMVVIFRGIGGT
jgi:site-specific DNA-methyltransferase (adenine-specific)